MDRFDLTNRRRASIKNKKDLLGFLYCADTDIFELNLSLL